jgi:hypothetical protein
MRRRTLAGLGVAAALGFGVFAATGLGNGGGAPEEVATKTLTTHAVAGPPDGVAAQGKRGGLFKITYRSTDPIGMPPGLTSFTIKACPKNGAVLNGWGIRSGGNKAGITVTGGTPDGLRKWQTVVNNTTGVTTDARFGLICIK